MNILITGADGFIGAAASVFFRDQGWVVHGWGKKEYCDIPGVFYEQVIFPKIKLEESIRRVNPDVCLHCAGSASVDASVADPEHDFQANVFGTVNMLSALRLAAPACKFIFLSSAAVYGEPSSLPIKEESAIQPISPYGYHKYICEQLLQEFFHIYQLPTMSLRIFSAYGPGLKRQVVFDTSLKALQQDEIHMRGTGKESRDFIFISDLLKLFKLLVEKGEFTGKVYNVGSGVETSILYVANLISGHFGGKRVVFDQQAGKGNPMNWKADIGQISALGFEPEISIEKGIDLYLQWLLKTDPRFISAST